MTEQTEHRQTPTEKLFALAMAQATRQAEPPESAVSLKRNAKGVFEFEAVVRGYDAEECEFIAKGIVDRLVTRYPYPAEGEAP